MKRVCVRVCVCAVATLPRLAVRLCLIISLVILLGNSCSDKSLPDNLGKHRRSLRTVYENGVMYVHCSLKEFTEMIP